MSLFTRSFRPATQALRMSARQYSTAATATSATGIYVGAATLAAGGAGYYFLSSSATSTSKPIDTTPLQDSKSGILTQDNPKTFPGGGLAGFVTLELASVEPLSHNVKRFRFALPSAEHVSGIPAGSAALLKYKDPSWWFPVLRPYSPTSTVGEQGYIEFVIKQYPGGKMSPNLHQMKPGDKIDIKAPLPGPTLKTNEHKNVVLIAGGTGITPLYGLMRSIFANKDDRTKITLLYGNQSEQDVVLKSEIESLRAQFPDRLSVVQTLTQPPDDWYEGVGQVNRKFIEDAAPKPDEDVKIFVCGPAPMYKAVAGSEPGITGQGTYGGILKELGYTKEQVYKF